jgi:hypothetical protein
LASILSRLIAFATSPFKGKGGAPSRKDVDRVLKDRIVENYRPTLPGSGFWGDTGAPDLSRLMGDVEAMVAHPRVSHALDYFKAGIANAMIEVEDASSPEVGKFAQDEAMRFWGRHRRAAQRSYEYGRGGSELIYADEGGALRLAGLEAFCGLDCSPLVRDNRYVGIRVRGTEAGGTSAGLWGPRPGLPAKGWWHAHDRRYSRWYGVPRTYPAWRPWRRLAGKDGAEDIVDGGVYRFAFQPPIGRYPPDDNTPVEPGGVAYSNRDKMREMLESLKAGGVAALSSLMEDGHYRWDVQWPEGSLDVGGLMAYTDSLEKAISLGCGVPPELIEASEVGSGYSGRAIPLEAFYVVQQGHAEDLLQSWYTQIGAPLLMWNFGPGSWARLKVADLLKTRLKASKEAQGGEQGQGQGQGPAAGGPAGQGNPMAALLGGGS